MKERIRLNKYISASGFCSRRKADEWITAGKVTVNGALADLGMLVSDEDDIYVNGKRIVKKAPLMVKAFYKPKGYSCTFHRKDPTAIFRHFDLDQSLKYVGRLDKDSEGLLLFTNDGDLCNRIAKAGNRHEKEYMVTVHRPVTEEFLRGIADGVRIFDPNHGKWVTTRPCQVSKLEEYKFSIVLTQGLNRQI